LESTRLEINWRKNWENNLYMQLFKEIKWKKIESCKVGKHIAILLVDQNVKVMSEVLFLINQRLNRKNLMTFY